MILADGSIYVYEPMDQIKIKEGNCGNVST
jgi:hypothetical protein